MSRKSYQSSVSLVLTKNVKSAFLILVHQNMPFKFRKSQVWGHTPGRLKHEDPKFVAGLGDLVRPCLKTRKTEDADQCEGPGLKPQYHEIKVSKKGQRSDSVLSACLAHTRLWVPFPALQKKKKAGQSGAHL